MLRKLWYETRDAACKTELTGLLKPLEELVGERHLNGGKQK